MYIKEFASKYELTTDTARYYEKEGMILPTRLNNGYRFYDETCEKNIKFILVLKQLNFSLQEIKMLLLLDNSEPSNECNGKSVTLFQSKISYLESQIEFFKTAVQALQTVAGLMEERKYIENKEKLEILVEEMYQKLEGAIKEYVPS
ncbi:MerR family transcriptional regulator [Rummeliibacillus sp. TYF-LIM-RU47]|uniref:MerR family transcriptional regulator n=1 Tax=Rummeliibacillus sp. TYF-LIM-RU47 TaxID=2608406 RepID=UPI00123A84AA|nr:MerR family transcriptional regulator [Rummeliibacillus sp. TYF-LIM-RU47]